MYWLHNVDNDDNNYKNYSDDNNDNDRKEGYVLFNDALNTFYLRLYGVRHMVKDYSNSETVKPAAATWVTLSDYSKSSFICTIPQAGYTFATPVVEHWLEREIAQWVIMTDDTVYRDIRQIFRNGSVRNLYDKHVDFSSAVSLIKTISFINF